MNARRQDTAPSVRINNADGVKICSVVRGKSYLFGLRSWLRKLELYDVFSITRSHNGGLRLTVQRTEIRKQKHTVAEGPGPSQHNGNLHCWIITVASASGAHTNDRWLEEQQCDKHHRLTRPVTWSVCQRHETAIFAMTNTLKN